MKELARKNQPLITTIIPTYRRPQFLKRAILSVLNQTYPHIKICVYDNASGDTTAEVVKELIQIDPRITYYCHPQNIGAFNNFNFGFNQVDTPYFSILSDDDVLLPDFYKEAVAGFKRYPEAGIIITQTILATEKEIKNISFEGYEEKIYHPVEGLLKLSEPGLVTWTGILFKKEVLKLGPLGEEEDKYFLLRISSTYPYGVIKIPGAIFYLHESSFSCVHSRINFLDGHKKALEGIRNSDYFPVSLREQVYQNFVKDIKHSLWLGGLVDIKNMKFLEAKQASEALKNDYGEGTKSFVIDLIARLCEFSSVFYNLFITLNHMRRFMYFGIRVKENRLQAKYGSYLKYLDQQYKA